MYLQLIYGTAAALPNSAYMISPVEELAMVAPFSQLVTPFSYPPILHLSLPLQNCNMMALCISTIFLGTKGLILHLFDHLLFLKLLIVCMLHLIRSLIMPLIFTWIWFYSCSAWMEWLHFHFGGLFYFHTLQ